MELLLICFTLLQLAVHNSRCRKIIFPGLAVIVLAACLPTAVPLSSSPHFNSFGQIQKVVGKPTQKPAPVTKEKLASHVESRDDTNSMTPSDDETVDAFIRLEYEAWTIANNKTSSEERYAIFKSNFLETLRKYESSGEYHALNKYADMTPDEFKSQPAPVDEIDVYVRSEYKAWLEQYGKMADAKRYLAFKDNFLMTMKIFEETGKFNALNEHGDMTREEFLRMQTKLAISSKAPMGGTGVNGQGASNIYSISAPQSHASYPRSSAMTFIPVSPGAQSDILGKGSSSSGHEAWGGGGGGGGWGSTTWDGGSSSSYSGDSGGGGRGGGDWDAAAGSSGEWGWGTPAPSYAPTPASYPRPSSMTFTPVTSSPASDILHKKSSSSGNVWGRPGSSSSWGPQETSSPMVGPQVESSPWSTPRGGTPSPQGPPSGPYSSSEYSRPSSMTFTPVTMRSQSDVLNNGSSSSRNDSWGMEDWGFTGRSTSAPPPQPYTPSNPSGVTFKSITPNSSSDILNRGGSGQNRNGRASQAASSSYAPFPDAKGKGNFSYMPKSVGSQTSERPDYDGGPSSQFGKPSATSFMNTSGGKKLNSPLSGNAKSDSLWNKMASAVEALAGGPKPSSYSSPNKSLSGNPKSNISGTSDGDRSLP